MFDIGFFELVVVGLVALLVLGPEKLPDAIRTTSLWIGRLRRSFNTIKKDIEREVGADEIRRQLRNEEIVEKYRHVRSQVNNAIGAVRQEADALRKFADLEAQAVESASNPLASTTPPAQPQVAVASHPDVATDTPTPAVPAAPGAETATEQQQSSP